MKWMTVFIWRHTRTPGPSSSTSTVSLQPTASLHSVIDCTPITPPCGLAPLTTHCSQVTPLPIQTILTTRPARPHRSRGVNPRNQRVITVSSEKMAVVPCDINVKMALINTRSLSNKSFIFNDNVTSSNLDFLFPTETWVRCDEQSQLIELCPPNYKFISFPRSHSHGGGLAVVFRSHYNCSSVHFGAFSTFKKLAFKIICTTSSVLSIIIYRPPKCKHGFLEEFSELLSTISTEFDYIIISEDFNFHVDNPNDHDSTEFINLLQAFDFSQHVSGPTHNRSHTLDLIIGKGLILDWGDCNIITISHHFCIYFDASFTPQKVLRMRTVKKRYIGADTAKSFTESFTTSMSDLALSISMSPDVLVDNFNLRVTNLIDNIAPLKTKTISVSGLSAALPLSVISQVCVYHSPVLCFIIFIHFLSCFGTHCCVSFQVTSLPVFV